MCADHLTTAVHELAEAKRLAILFGWPQETIDRIDLLKRAVAKTLSQMLGDSGREISDSASSKGADRVTGQPTVGPADRPEYFSGTTIENITKLVEKSTVSTEIHRD